MLTLISILIVIALIFIELLLEALVFWGVGCLFVYVFNIPFVWTFFHGCVLACGAMAIKAIFKGGE